MVFGQRRSASPVQLSVILDEVDVGGAEVVLLNVLRRLDRSVVVPRLLCLRERGLMAAEFEDAGIPVHVAGRSGRYDLRTIPRLMRHFRRYRTDVVLVTHLNPAPLTLGRIAAWLSRRASVVTPHGMDLLTHTGQRILPRHDVATFFLSNALVLVAESQGAYLRRVEGVGRHPWSRIREVVIRNGIPLPPPPTPSKRAEARTMLGLREDDIAVGIVARLVPVKAHHVLLDAVARLAPREPRLRLVCIGDGALKAELEKRAIGLGLGERVRFTGLRRDVPDLLPGLDIACLTSRYECAPLSIMEAMAAGVPVVTTDVGAVRDMIDDSVEGFIVPPGDADALASRIALLAGDADLRSRLGSNGRARAERDFSIEATVAGYERLLTSLVRPSAEVELGGAPCHARML
jgi:glycosyltransferase involved in cell wall biosynthesis